MAADAWKIYDSFKQAISDGSIDMGDAGAGVFKCALLLSGYIPDQTHGVYGDLTNQVAGSYGYDTAGKALTTVTWVDTSGTTKWDCDNIVWTASGVSIVAYYAVIYQVATGQLIAYSLLDNAPADVTATNGNTFTITIHANGVFTLSGGW